MRPPLTPMLAKLARELPRGDGWWFEPKWEGFRCLVFCDGDEVELQSRNARPLGRYFPELVAAVRSVGSDRFVADGEIVVTVDGIFDFDALLARLHPSTAWADERARATPASFVAFDVLAVGDDDLRGAPFGERRARLEELLGRAEPPVQITPGTAEREVAADWLARFIGGGLDGVVAKPDRLRYEPGKRAMVKVKRERTADCVVAGFRWLARSGADAPAVSSLLLGLYGEAGELHHVAVSSAFSTVRRAELVEQLRPYATTLEAHPWAQGFGLAGGRIGRFKGTAGGWTPDMTLDWVSLRPVLVCEVGFDQLEGHPGASAIRPGSSVGDRIGTRARAGWSRSKRPVSWDGLRHEHLRGARPECPAVIAGSGPVAGTRPDQGVARRLRRPRRAGPPAARAASSRDAAPVPRGCVRTAFQPDAGPPGPTGSRPSRSAWSGPGRCSTWR